MRTATAPIDNRKIGATDQLNLRIPTQVVIKKEVRDEASFGKATVGPDATASRAFRERRDQGRIRWRVKNRVARGLWYHQDTMFGKLGCF